MTAKRRAIFNQRGNNCNCLPRKCCCDGDEWKRQKCIPGDGFMQGLDLRRYGSVTEDIEALIALRKSYMTFDHGNMSTSVHKTLNAAENQSQHLRAEHAGLPEIIILDDDDDDVQTKEFHLYPVTTDLEGEDSRSHKISSPLLEIDAKMNVNQISTNHLDVDFAQSQCLREENFCSTGETETKGEHPVDLGIESENAIEDISRQSGANDITNIWNEMTVALELSKDTSIDCSDEARDGKNVEGCEHSLILKEDIGYVCRICGLIQKAIETIIEFQYAKAKRSGRTYPYQASSGRDLEQTKTIPGSFILASHDYPAVELTVHPRHGKVMKRHQVEGFNFLLSNLVGDNPGGCIMAHAPGSGKTFMIISFLRSFMAKFPAARPLIVLPRGIVSTWKKEIQRWQLEDVPLYDFYSSKADSRSQQLEILQQWRRERSILFLGYKQFSSIVCHTNADKLVMECAKILLTCPSILIMGPKIFFPSSSGPDWTR